MTTNTKGALWAQNAVTCFAVETGMTGEEVDSQMSDLLCDMMHLEKKESVDFMSLMEIANRNFEDELQIEIDADKETKVLSSVGLYILNKTGYHFVVHFPLDFAAMPGAVGYDNHELLLEAHAKASGIDLDELGESIEFCMTSDGYSETALNTCVYPVDLKDGQSIEQYINDWIV
ncbi:MAG: hypothetical protein HRT95_13115 [Moritella sp.]|uniref:hypothetical protein n=1 Tax=Moritella sp. TaxID=78556 RepID=UPI001DC29BBA|nr:hypothetical protein [Moritella sp.]NQZ51066.1 hypothetical protein [Moritella sp.]